MSFLSDIAIAIFPYAVCLLALYALIFALPRYLCGAYAMIPKRRWLQTLTRRPAHASKGARTPFFRVILCVLLAFLVSRLAVWLIGLVGYALRGDIASYLSKPSYVWVQWDAHHYLGIAENGYVTQGDARFHIVFYPLYPLFVKALRFLFGSAERAAFALSNACLLASGVALFRLTEFSYNARVARRAVWLFLFCPATVFFSVPYTESLFVLLTLLCALMARTRRFAWALAFGALSAFTRLPGIVSAVPIFYEMLLCGAVHKPADLAARERRRFMIALTAKSALKCLLVLMGFCAYLLINKAVTGNAFQFLVYQREHWGQRAGNLWKTAGYSIYYAFFPNLEWYRMGVWIPQCASILLFALLLAFSAKRAHPGDMAYAIVYFLVVLSPTMLISGPRYLCAMYAAYPMIAILPKKRGARYIAYLLQAALFLYCTWMFILERTLL